MSDTVYMILAALFIFFLGYNVGNVIGYARGMKKASDGYEEILADFKRKLTDIYGIRNQLF